GSRQGRWTIRARSARRDGASDPSHRPALPAAVQERIGAGGCLPDARDRSRRHADAVVRGRVRGCRRALGPGRVRRLAPPPLNDGLARHAFAPYARPTMRAMLLVLLATASISAHIVPVPPSTCAFDPITVEMPVAGTAAPAGPSDTLRILYDPQSSTAQFELRSVPPRS